MKQLCKLLTTTVKRYRCIALTAALVLLSACSESYNVTDDQGHGITAASVQGEWIIINDWATWCHPCHAEVSELNQFAQHLPPHTQLFGMNHDHLSGAPLQKAIKQMGIQFPVLVGDVHTLWSWPTISVVPTTLIVNPQGHIVKTLFGPQTAASLRHTLQQLSQTQS